MWKCKKVTHSLGLGYQVRCSETTTNCTFRERSTNRLRTVEKKTALHSLDRQTFEKPFFFHESSQRSFWLPWRPSEMLEPLQVSLAKRYLLYQKYPCWSPNGKWCWIRSFCHHDRTCWSVGWLVLLPGNASSSWCYNVLAVLRLYSRRFEAKEAKV